MMYLSILREILTSWKLKPENTGEILQYEFWICLIPSETLSTTHICARLKTVVIQLSITRRDPDLV